MSAGSRCPEGWSVCPWLELSMRGSNPSKSRSSPDLKGFWGLRAGFYASPKPKVESSNLSCPARQVPYGGLGSSRFGDCWFLSLNPILPWVSQSSTMGKACSRSCRAPLWWRFSALDSVLLEAFISGTVRSNVATHVLGRFHREMERSLPEWSCPALCGR